jgi:glutamate-1-semialdehyde 2,1-aminomutase
LILGHADERIVAAVDKAASKGWGFPSLTETSVRLAELIASRFSTIDMVRLVNSPAEAAVGAIQLARTQTQREQIAVVQGCLRSDGEGALSAVAPQESTLVISYNSADGAQRVFKEHGSSIAAVLVDPAATGLGLIPPDEGFLQTLRHLCDKHGAQLIFDETVTGFRVASGGAAMLFSVTPDLTCLGPILGGGLPLAAYGGRKDLMKLVPSAWGVDYATGASTANALAIAAGVAALEALSEPGFYEDLEAKAARLEEGLQAATAAANVPVNHTRVGSLLGMSFVERRGGGQAHAPSSAVTASSPGVTGWTRYYHATLDRGIFLPPAPSTCMCVSAAHTVEQIDETIAAAHNALNLLSTEADE